MKEATVISEYEELIKAKMFFIEKQRGFHDLTFEKIKKGLSSEYLGNLNEKITRWIDTTFFQYFRKSLPVEYYILSKMLYRDGFYEAAIITCRSICEMVCHDILRRIPHAFGSADEISQVNFRTLLRFVCIPKILSKEVVETQLLGKLSKPQDQKVIKGLFNIHPEVDYYSLNMENAKKPSNLANFFSLCSQVGFALFENLSRAVYIELNHIYDLGNRYVHASSRSLDPKRDSRKVLVSIGKILYDIYGIESTEDLRGINIETPYGNHPDICSGINFMIEVFASPDDAQRGYLNLPSETFLQKLKSAAGAWEGIWSCSGRIVENAKLSIVIDNDTIKAFIEHALEYGETTIGLVEECGVGIYNGYFQIQGLKTNLASEGVHIQYSFDFFELEFLTDDILVGAHSCQSGNGKAMFRREAKRGC